jgi:periplasmic copper chaperone A
MTATRTRRAGALAAVLLAGALALGACGRGGTTAVPSDLEITGVWARPTPPGAENGVAYLSITSPVDDRLLSATVPADIAGQAAVHESMLMDDSASGSGAAHHGGGAGASGGGESMETTIELPAGQAVALAPGGDHVMLIGLAAPLLAGEEVPITLTFEVAGTRTVDAEVRPNAP